MEEYHSLNQAVTFTYNSRWSSPIMDDEQIDAELNNLVDEVIFFDIIVTRHFE